MSQSAPPPTAIRRLPIGATILEAYGAVLSRLGLVFKAAAVPFALSIVIAMLSRMAHGNWFLWFILVALGFVPYTLFGVAWHRLTLLGPGVAPPPLIPGWSQRHWRFLSYFVAIILITNMVAVVFALFLSMLMGSVTGDQMSPAQGGAILIVAVTLMTVLCFVILRLSFVFPAVAVDEAYGLGHAWAHTRGQGLRLLAAVTLTALPMLVLIWSVATEFGLIVIPDVEITAGQAGPPPEPAAEEAPARGPGAIMFAEFLLAALNYILMALLVSVISIGFRTCTGWIPASAGGPPAVAEDPDEHAD